MSDRSAKGLASRRAAVHMLSSVLREGTTLEDAFHHQVESGLLANEDPRDRAFARNLVATALRRRGQISDALARFLRKPLPRKCGNALEILHIGAVQILFLGTAAHAAIDMAVRCAAADRGARPFKGLINAVLRRLSEQGADILEGQDAVMLNTPSWLFERWQRSYGTKTARAICTANAEPPSLDLSVKSEPQHWAEQLDAELLPTGSLRLVASGPVSDLPGFAEGAWWVQDAAAALPAKLLGDVRGRNVLDLCAAPGGKTMQLAAAGAKVTAVDDSSERLQTLAANLARTGLKAELVCADARKYAPARTPECILLDAPCTATGTIRRHPDILHTKAPELLPKLADLQREMLHHAVSLLEPGGLLVYCTCSLEPEEGERQIEDLLAQGLPVRRKPVMAEDVGGLSDVITQDGDLRTLPCHLPNDDPRLAGMDGFFASRLVKD